MNEMVQWELAQLIRVSWIVLIPVGVLLAVVLYKLAMLLHSVLDFITVARYEVVPALQDLRATAEHVESVSTRVAAGLRTMEEGMANARPALAHGVDTLKDRSRRLAKNTVLGLESLWSGIRASFSRKKEPRSPYRYYD